MRHLWPTSKLPEQIHLLLVQTELLLFGCDSLGYALRHAHWKCLPQTLGLLLLLRDAQSRCRIGVYDLLAHDWLIGIMNGLYLLL